MTAFTGEVHPLADWYPMLLPEELAALADDIKANGQLHPILITPGGVLVDGRNRLAACRIAGVEPVFQVTDADPLTLIPSANNRRRKMTAGQVAVTDAAAMRAAGLWNEATGRWRQGAAKVLVNAKTSSAADLAMAGQVLAHSEELAREVADGTLALRAAYDKVQTDKAETEARQKKHNELAEKAPDLLNLIDDDTHTLEMAWAAYQVRHKEEIEEEKRRAAFRADKLRYFPLTVNAIAHYAQSEETAAFFDTLIPDLDAEEFHPDAIDKAIAVLTKLKGKL
jgi:hypothetical protein